MVLSSRLLKSRDAQIGTKTKSKWNLITSNDNGEGDDLFNEIEIQIQNV
jgi:hypothetical protein